MRAMIGFWQDDEFIINYDAPLFECRRKIKAYKRKDKRNEVWL